MFTLVSLAAAMEHKGALQLFGGCKVQGPGADQTAAVGGQDGTVDGAPPHQAILKDGFWDVGCKSDQMVQTGDKFGDSKVDYAETHSASTSIVWYNVVVERDNQKSMTPQVCFDFCRTVADMSFFGLIYGRDCYCSHYYKQTIGDGVCDLPCEGGNGICGGQSMSSLYQMHSCEGGFAQEMQDLFDDGEEMLGSLSLSAKETMAVGNAMQTAGESLEALAEGAASPLAQEAKVAAGPVVHAADDLLDLVGEFTNAGSEFTALNLEGDLDFETRKKAEDLKKEGSSLMDAGDQALAAADDWVKRTNPKSDEEGVGATFVPVMRQVDVEFEGKQVICNGELTGAPKIGMSYDECASACDNEVPKSNSAYCIGFQYFTFPDADPLCFLYSELLELTTYSCDFEGDMGQHNVAFLARKHHKKKHHVRKHTVVDDAEEKVKTQPRGDMSSHPSSKFILSTLHLNYASGKESAVPQATCAVRFADFNGVTPKFKDGRTDITRCFGEA